MERSFWAIELIAGKEFTTTPEFDLHVTQAVLPASAKDTGRTVVNVSFPDSEEKSYFAIASVRLDHSDTQSLDLLFDADRPVSFTSIGKNPVHLIGYTVGPDDSEGGGMYGSYGSSDEELDSDMGEDFEEDGEDDEEDIANNQALQALISQKRKAKTELTNGNAPAAPAPKKAKQEQKPQEQKPKQEQKQQQQKQTPAKADAPKADATAKPQTPKQTEGNKKQKSPGQQQKEPSTKTLANGLQITILREGQSDETAVNGKKVGVKYVGRLTKNGKIFDAAKEKPFVFSLGKREVIPGWDLGVHGMKVGEKRRLVIPPQLAYGAKGAGSDIPPNSTLTFEIDLIHIK